MIFFNQGMLLLGSNHFLKKVAVHDDSFVENIDFDTASLSPANEGPDTDVYIEEVKEYIRREF